MIICRIMTYHLAILKKQYMDLILTGEKTVESRFTKTRRAPFGGIKAGDRIFLKLSSGPVVATAFARKVIFKDSLCPYQIEKIKQQYNQYILGSDEFWDSVKKSRYATLVWLEKIEPIKPLKINKKDWRAWVILTKQKNFSLLQ